jgi:chemotaxis protein CheZ
MISGNYEEYKDRLRELLVKMESSSAEEGMPMLDLFVKDYEESLYKEVGRLTRRLHDSLTTLEIEEKIINLTQEDIPGAKERLRYVVKVTEQATQNVLAIVEKSIPISLKIGVKADDLYGECLKIADGGYSRESISRLLDGIRGFLVAARENSGLLNGHLTEILMAQEYQDITGQIIKKVIGLVQDVEDSLVKLVKMTGHKRSTEAETRSGDFVNGPHVPGIDDNLGHVSNQDDVDHLLASLGF